MLYHGYRITFTGYDQGVPVFLISTRHSDEVLANASSACKAIDLINELEKHTELPFEASRRKWQRGG